VVLSDILLEEDLEYARRLLRAGVPTELHVYPGAYHGFDAIAPDSRVTQVYTRDYMDALRRALNAVGNTAAAGAAKPE